MGYSSVRQCAGKEKEWTDCEANDILMYGIRGVVVENRHTRCSVVVWHNTQGGSRFMDASSGGRKEGRSADTRLRTRKAEEADKVVLIPGITVRRLISYRAALIGPSQGFPKRRLLH